MNTMGVGWRRYAGAGVAAVLAVGFLYELGVPEFDVPPWLISGGIKVALAGTAFTAVIGLVALLNRGARTP